MQQTSIKSVKNVLISVFCKDRLHEIVECLNKFGTTCYSTGGTLSTIKNFGIKAQAVEDLTGYPSILGGRVKTLHPNIFGGILARTGRDDDRAQLEQYHIPTFDLVIVDLYPFEEAVRERKSEQDIIEKIDIGGISLIRAAAKNYEDVLVVSSRSQYDELLELLKTKKGVTDLADRKRFAAEAFRVSSHYDTLIFNYFNETENLPAFQQSITGHTPLRYGENPHQHGRFYGQLEALFDQLHGKEISYNNLLDIDAAVSLMREFDEPTVAILKHNNACGLASRNTIKEAWEAALAGDPLSAFGGVIIANRPIDTATAEAMHAIFFEVVIAPAYDEPALRVLQQKKNRIILLQKAQQPHGSTQFRSVLNGVLVQDHDTKTEMADDLTPVTTKNPTASETNDLLFANKIVKHSKSNSIVLAKQKQLYASGVGQTSRVDALKQAIEKAGRFGFDLHGAVMASDAFFPFPDCVEIAGDAGITAVVHPGGSVNDKLSAGYCEEHQIAMVTTGIRHFKH
ncbi:MAG: bifunctional phosphoribosylaminoimidazolecarboxamide formyltransferase/IMP cyclohydrolase [Prevotellaceae bacterium]|jgi:phosphoribosylaminoimidazolecarboxamide formyltransferase/IMP cyclohydrolase|nr:bifunctional phosphoribosylaminoimidazolecarboxamide formyltransferase/IMP cyclohydrolase [Prevotellaceae bacterium]